MSARKILIVDDDPVITEMVVSCLEESGYQTFSAGSGRDGFRIALRNLPDLVILDVMMPRVAGTDVCHAMRRNRKLKEVPIIFLTSCREETDRVTGLELGADDYIVKPFSLRELLLRIQAVLRRSGTTTTPSGTLLKVGPLDIRIDAHEIVLNKAPLYLTACEFKLLVCFAKHAGTMLSRTQLMDMVWGNDAGSEVRTIDTHINRLRSKMGKHGRMIKTVRGFGYILEPGGTHDDASAVTVIPS